MENARLFSIMTSARQLVPPFQLFANFLIQHSTGRRRRQSAVMESQRAVCVCLWRVQHILVSVIWPGDSIALSGKLDTLSAIPERFLRIARFGVQTHFTPSYLLKLLEKSTKLQ